MFIQLSNKTAFDTTHVNQIEKFALVHNLIFDGGKAVQVSELELEWILRICGHLIYVTPELSFNLDAVVSFADQGDSCVINLRNGFSFQLTKLQAQNLGAICAGQGHKILDLDARVAELMALGVSKDEYLKI